MEDAVTRVLPVGLHRTDDARPLAVTDRHVAVLHGVVWSPAVVRYTLPAVPGTPAMRRLVAKERHRNATEGKRVSLGQVVERAH